MKLLKLLILMIASLAFVNVASAITTYAEFQNQQPTISINDNDQVYFDYSLFTINSPITYSVKMYDHNLNLIKNYQDTTENVNFVSKRQYVTKDDYKNTGSYTIVVYGTDGVNDASSSIITLIVNPIILNHDPILNPIGNRMINEGELLKFTVTAYDQDNDPLTLTSMNLPQGATFTDNHDNTALFNWQTDFNSAGTYNVKFIVNDNKGGSDSEEITITVNNVQVLHNPTIKIINPSENETISGIYEVKWDANDLDQTKQSLDIKLEYTYNGYDWIILEDGQDNNDGIFTWNTLSLSNAKDYKLRVIVTDDQGNKANDLVNFKVNNLYAPSVNFIKPSESEVIFGMYNILWQANDVDQDSNTLDIKLEYRKKTSNIFINVLRIFSPDWIVLEDAQDNNDGIFTWNTKTVDNGNYELRMIATDDDYLTATDYVSSFIINNQVSINHNPVIISTPITTALVNKVYNYDVDAIDQDNDPLTYKLTSYPSGMNIDENSGLITWIPNQIQIGNNFVSVLVEDGKGGFDTQEFNVLVSKETIIIQQVESHVHRFSINNVILKYNDNDLNVYAYVRNEGNQDERINLKATLMQNSLQEITAFNLDRNDNKWQTLTFDNLKKGYYIVKVEAFNSKHYEVKYAYVNI